MNTRYTKKEFEKLLTEKLFNEFAIDIASATDEQIYRALALIARGMLSEKRKRFIARTYGANGKQVYYLCMEFLMGRSLKTSLLNLGLCGVADEVLRDYSMKLDNIYEQEPGALACHRRSWETPLESYPATYMSLGTAMTLE